MPDLNLSDLSNLKFNCLMCGKCCHEVPFVDSDAAYKRIPLYPEEADRLRELSDGIEMRIVEDLVFPDVKNSKILVLTYRIMLDNGNKVCPFHDSNSGCRIQDKKPLACLAYPLAVKQEDAFNMKIEIDPLCKFTIENYDELTSLDAKNIKIIYDIEYKRAERMLIRNKKAIFNLKILEKERKIEIPKNIESSEFDNALKNWERMELNSLDDE